MHHKETTLNSKNNEFHVDILLHRKEIRRTLHLIAFNMVLFFFYDFAQWGFKLLIEIITLYGTAVCSCSEGGLKSPSTTTSLQELVAVKQNNQRLYVTKFIKIQTLRT